MKQHHQPTAVLLRDAGLLATKQRIKLLHVLLSSKHPQSVEEISKARNIDMNLTTIYRNLRGLVSSGLARRIDFGENHALYEAEKEHHHHVVCRICSRVEDIPLCLPADFSNKVKKIASGFSSIGDHALEFFGVCKQCSSKSL